MRRPETTFLMGIALGLLTLSGCDAAKVKALESKVQQLETKNSLLSSENGDLKSKGETCESSLQTATKLAQDYKRQAQECLKQPAKEQPAHAATKSKKKGKKRR